MPTNNKKSVSTPLHLLQQLSHSLLEHLEKACTQALVDAEELLTKLEKQRVKAQEKLHDARSKLQDAAKAGKAKAQEKAKAAAAELEELLAALKTRQAETRSYIAQLKRDAQESLKLAQGVGKVREAAAKALDSRAVAKPAAKPAAKTAAKPAAKKATAKPAAKVAAKPAAKPAAKSAAKPAAKAPAKAAAAKPAVKPAAKPAAKAAAKPAAKPAAEDTNSCAKHRDGSDKNQSGKDARPAADNNSGKHVPSITVCPQRVLSRGGLLGEGHVLLIGVERAELLRKYRNEQQQKCQDAENNQPKPCIIPGGLWDTGRSSIHHASPPKFTRGSRR